VQRYVEGMSAMHAAVDGRAAVGLYFDTLLTNCSSLDSAQKHCIVTNGLLEGVQEPELQWALQSKWLATHELLRSAVERGQRDGSIANGAPSAELAELLMALTSGLRVAARAGRSATQMRRSVSLTLGVLDQA
jgi:TetR/AcrR family transcriptional regulator, transcriptional repressor for nem operon